MAAMAYLTAVGARQGDIKGDVTLKGREGSVALVSVSHEIDTPYDVATGHISGKRQHKPLVVIALLDRATPKLYQALVTNEVLTGVKIEFWRPAPEIVAPYYVIALTNAAIVGIELAPSAEPHDRNERLQIQFIYEKIVETYTETGDSFDDSWSAP